MLLPPFSDLAAPLDHSEQTLPVLKSLSFPRFNSCLNTYPTDQRINNALMQAKHLSSLDSSISQPDLQAPTPTTSTIHSVSTPQTGQRNLSSVTWPNGFQLGVLIGKLHRIKPDEDYFGRLLPPSTSRSHHSKCFSSWREYFLDLVDQQLQVAEDTLVYIPASSIQDHIQRLSIALDDVSEPRLCITTPEIPCQRVTGDHNKSWSGGSTLSDRDRLGSGDIKDEANIVESIASDSLVLGDTFFSPAFQNPTLSFLDGIGVDLTEQLKSPRSWSLGARLSMYKAYHAISCLLHHYSDRNDINRFATSSSAISQHEDEQIEMEARGRLTEALNEMAYL